MTCGWAPLWLSEFSAAVSAILSVFTIFGNLLVCIAVLKDPHRNLRTPYMFILVNLAVTDLVVGLITLPISVATHSLEALGTKKTIHVTVSRIILFISCTASVLNLTALCLDRYASIHYPFKYQRFISPFKCLLLFCTIWIFAISICMLYFITNFMNFLIIFAQISIVIVIVITSVTFGLLRRLMAHMKEHREITYKKNEATRRSDHRIIQTFMLMLIMFFVCYTPSIIFMYVLKLCTSCSCNVHHILRDLNFLFIASNSAVNPFVCTIRLKPFREALKTIFKGPKESVMSLPVISNWAGKNNLTMQQLRNLVSRGSATTETMAYDDQRAIARLCETRN